MPMSASTPFAGANRRRSLFIGWLIVALAIFAALAAATLCPIQWRPRLSNDADAERFWAFFLLGMAAKFATPRRHLSILIIVALIAFGTEAMQLVVPGRHARLPDGTVKCLGAVAGVMAGYACFKLRRMWRALTLTDGQGRFVPN
jgi:VanZ family protein